MKKLLLLLIHFGCGTAAMSQDSAPFASHLLFSVGPALPLGSFSSTSFDREYPAFADVGTFIQLNYTQSLKPHIALGATAGYRRNPFLEEEFAAPGDELVQELKSKPWQTGYVLADVQVQAPLGRNGMAFIRGSAGGAFIRAASLQVQTPYGTISRSSDKRVTPTFGATTGLKGEQNRIVIGIETSLLFMRPSLEVKNQQGATDQFHQPMNSANFSLSVGYRL
ncbi:hypothetical protein [Pontibacter saemangeumensis]